MELEDVVGLESRRIEMAGELAGKKEFEAASSLLVALTHRLYPEITQEMGFALQRYSQEGVNGYDSYVRGVGIKFGKMKKHIKQEQKRNSGEVRVFHAIAEIRKQQIEEQLKQHELPEHIIPNLRKAIANYHFSQILGHEILYCTNQKKHMKEGLKVLEGIEETAKSLIKKEDYVNYFNNLHRNLVDVFRGGTNLHYITDYIIGEMEVSLVDIPARKKDRYSKRLEAVRWANEKIKELIGENGFYGETGWREVLEKKMEIIMIADRDNDMKKVYERICLLESEKKYAEIGQLGIALRKFELDKEMRKYKQKELNERAINSIRGDITTLFETLYQIRFLEMQGANLDISSGGKDKGVTKRTSELISRFHGLHYLSGGMGALIESVFYKEQSLNQKE